MIKSLNYLNNLHGKMEARIAGVEEAIILNQEGFVAECTGDNIFMIKKGSCLHPRLLRALAGITRAAVIEIAETMGLGVIEKNLTGRISISPMKCF